LTAARLTITRENMSDLNPGAAPGLDHASMVGADVDGLAQAFGEPGFCVTPCGAHMSGLTGNRGVIFPSWTGGSNPTGLNNQSVVRPGGVDDQFTKVSG
jgi:hypothetical protein